MTIDLRSTAVAVIVAMGLAGAADAATVSPITTAPASTANPVANSTTGTVYQGVTGNIVGVRLTPFNNPNLAYTSVSGNATATYLFGGLQSAISLVWGSPDSYNLIQFIKGGTVVDSVTGSGLTQGYFSVAASSVFDSIVISSGHTNAFEFGALSATPSAVPVPAAGLLLAGALAGLGAVRRRRAA